MDNTPSASRRLVCATTWARPALLAAYILAVGPSLPEGTEFVFVVPQEPTATDGEAATTVIEGTREASSHLRVSVESFSEAVTKPYNVALVPPADQVGAWEAVTLAIVEGRHIRAMEAKDGSKLHALLQDFDETEHSTPPVTEVDETEHSTPPVTEVAAAAQPTRWSAYLGDGMTLVKMRWGGRIAVPTSHVRLLGNLIETGEFEPTFAAYLSRVINAGDLVVDVGANIGLHTVLMGMLTGASGRVIAYEPFPQNLSCLHRSVAASTLIGVVDVRAKAASDARGNSTMAVSEMWRGQGSLVRDKVEIIPGLKDEQSYHIDVETVRLDDDLAEEQQISLVKIDVEGAEEKVFAGMDSLMRSGGLDRIAFECYRTHIGKDWPAFCTRLKTMENHGWVFRILDNTGADYAVPAQTIIDHGVFETVIAEAPHLS